MDKDEESSISDSCAVTPDPQVSPDMEDTVKPKESVSTSAAVPTVQEGQLGEVYAW